MVTETGIINTTEEVYSNSWGDVNGDGYLDCYIAVYEMLLDEYDERNYLYLNNGDWTFTEMGDTNPANDGYNMSFMGTFMDYDNDNDPDIFVNNDRNKCRQTSRFVIGAKIPTSCNCEESKDPYSHSFVFVHFCLSGCV